MGLSAALARAMKPGLSGRGELPTRHLMLALLAPAVVVLILFAFKFKLGIAEPFGSVWYHGLTSTTGG